MTRVPDSTVLAFCRDQREAQRALRLLAELDRTPKAKRAHRKFLRRAYGRARVRAIASGLNATRPPA